MPNNYFQFKQFTIQQEHCAMKVTTDACLFGAVIADEIMKLKVKSKNVLDIGTGTGLLSLMLAQKISGNINAVEIDEAAAKQAISNIAATPWKDKITVYHQPVLDFVPGLLYDLIISNPPFYEKDLKSPDNKINAARHDDTLRLEQLVNYACRHLTAEGHLALLLPFHRRSETVMLAEEAGLYLLSETTACQTPKHKPFRSIMIFNKQKQIPVKNEIFVKDETGDYSARFRSLLKDYYLSL